MSPRSSVLLLALLFAGPAARARRADPPAFTPVDPKVLQGWMSEGTPVAEHARLRDYVGTWTTQQTDWLPSGRAWNQAAGTATFHLVLGGRFVQEDYTTTLDGKPFHALGLMGFDRQKKAYNSLWMDDLNTGFIALDGTFDGTGRVLTLLGGIPAGGSDSASAAAWRVVDTWWDPDHHAVIWWGRGAAGQPVKLSQILYTRTPAKVQ
ncbi:MAG TPA: DUF1579 family protein [Holophagaceae bacterium]